MKNLKLEKYVSIFIILLPILDILSFIFRNFFHTSFSPSTVIRPLIPIFLFVYLFFKNNFKIKSIIIFFIYGIYSLIHLYIFYTIKTPVSYGSITHEAQYLVNYSFAILNLFIFLYVFYNNNPEIIYKSILISNAIYILSIYLSIFTRTSSTTYLEGFGYKGWFESGNALSSILILNLFIIFSYMKKANNNKIKCISVIEIIASGIFLFFLLGTRTGLFGYVLVLCLYIFAHIFNVIKGKIVFKQNKFSKKSIIIICICVIVVIASLIVVFINGNKLLKRRQYLKSIQNNIIDNATGFPSHITGDTLKFKEKIENNLISEDYMSIPAQKSIIDLYNFANKNNLSLTNRRMQQLAYNIYLVKNQSNILYIIFGNGFLANYGELILEMEIPALLLNFGLIGFILYFIPFLTLFIYFIKFGIKNIKYVDLEYLMLFSGIIMAFTLSFLLGQVLFNSSAMILIVSLNALLLNKCHNIKSLEIKNINDIEVIEIGKELIKSN